MNHVFLIFCLLYSVAIFGQSFNNRSIYFIMIDRFYDGNNRNNPSENLYSKDRSKWKLYWGGDIEGITKKLPYIKEMGFGAIWITPVVKNTDKLAYYGKNKKNCVSSYHGYWAEDFKQVNPYFGTKQKLRTLIDEAHKLDIKVILDVVLNHTNPIGQADNGLLYDNGKKIADYSNDPHNWFHHNGSINFSKNPTEKQWQDQNLFDLADLNQNNPEVVKYLFDATKYWLKLGFDGLRIDTARHLPQDFCKNFVKSMQKAKPELYIFGEWSSGGLDVQKTINFTNKTKMHLIDFKFCKLLRKVVCEDNSFALLANYIKHQKNIPDPDLVVNCIDNHDMSRFMSLAREHNSIEEKAIKQTQFASYIMMTSRGIPCIYYGTEQFIHVDKKTPWGVGNDPYNRPMINDWTVFNSFMKNIRTLNSLRRNNRALSNGTQRNMEFSKNVWCFERKYKGDVVLVIANKGKKTSITVKTSLPDGKYSKNGKNKRKYLGQDITVKKHKVTVTIPEYQVGIYGHIKGNKQLKF